MGVWIETYLNFMFRFALSVTPCMGVWIETFWRCGKNWSVSEVTPCMGVWIETYLNFMFRFALSCHTLYGCVD